MERLQVSPDVAALNPGLVIPEEKHNKYHNIPCVLEGVNYDSGKEAGRGQELGLAMKAGEIICIAYHPRFLISPENSKPIYYEPDFVYLDSQLKVHVEDVKSEPTKTRTYKIKKKLFEGKFGIPIEEV